MLYLEILICEFPAVDAPCAGPVAVDKVSALDHECRYDTAKRVFEMIEGEVRSGRLTGGMWHFCSLVVRRSHCKDIRC
jgi:hypothetical protein